MERLKRTERKKSFKPGGCNRAVLRHNKYEEAAERADKELLTYQVGEFSPAFIPVTSDRESIAETQIVFDASLNQVTFYEGRKADVAKKRGDIINDLLENPEDFPLTKSNVHFIRRHFERISRFIKTLKRKGKLHPEAESFIKV